jgi:hypothetical protein
MLQDCQVAENTIYEALHSKDGCTVGETMLTMHFKAASARARTEATANN